MAFFELVKLFIDNDEDNDYVEFSVNTEIVFEEHEKDIDWLLTMEFLEHDVFSPDDWICKSVKQINPQDLKETFRVKINRNRLDKDWFKEEVYVKVKLKPTKKYTHTPAVSEPIKFPA